MKMRDVSLIFRFLLFTGIMLLGFLAYSVVYNDAPKESIIFLNQNRFLFYLIPTLYGFSLGLTQVRIIFPDLIELLEAKKK